jgi:hypothetical protein
MILWKTAPSEEMLYLRYFDARNNYGPQRGEQQRQTYRKEQAPTMSRALLRACNAERLETPKKPNKNLKRKIHGLSQYPMHCSFANGREELVQRQKNRVRQNSRSDWDADSSDEEMNKEPKR